MSENIISPENGAIALVGVMVTAVLSFLGGKGSAQAAQQTAFNEMAKTLIDSVRAERDDCHKKLEAVDGELRQQRQIYISLVNQLSRQGIDIAHPELLVETVFVLDSQAKEPEND